MPFFVGSYFIVKGLPGPVYRHAYELPPWEIQVPGLLSDCEKKRRLLTNVPSGLNWYVSLLSLSFASKCLQIPIIGSPVEDPVGAGVTLTTGVELVQPATTTKTITIAIKITRSFDIMDGAAYRMKNLSLQSVSSESDNIGTLNVLHQGYLYRLHPGYCYHTGRYL